MGRLRATVTCEVNKKGLVFHLHAHDHLYMTIMMFLVRFRAGGVRHVQKNLRQRFYQATDHINVLLISFGEY